MDAEGYPEESELGKIRKWDFNDVFGLIIFIKDRWAYADSGYLKYKWGWERKYGRIDKVLNLELHTAGWSGNESMIDALMKNRMVMAVIGYYQWNTGGHYKFRVNPRRFSYMPVSEMAKSMNCSRQLIHKAEKRFDWLLVGDRSFYVRKRSTASDAPTKPH